MKTWQTGVMVAKKDFCQEGENLVNRRLLRFMLHLAAHCLAHHAIAFLLSLSCSCIHGLHLNRNLGATPYSVMESFFCNSHQLFQLHLSTVAHVTFQVHSNVCVCLLLSTYFGSLDSNVPPITCQLETHNAKNL